jgi:hypothetical protein
MPSHVRHRRFTMPIPDRATEEARRWRDRVDQDDEASVRRVEETLLGYGLPSWARLMLAEQLVALVRLSEKH